MKLRIPRTKLSSLHRFAEVGIQPSQFSVTYEYYFFFQVIAIRFFVAGIANSRFLDRRNVERFSLVVQRVAHKNSLRVLLTGAVNVIKMAAAMASRKVTQLLKTPSHIAKQLDWKKVSGSVVCLDISRDSMGVAIASHPALGEPTQVLTPIALHREGRGKMQVLSSEVISELSDIFKSHKVCGVIVSWPIQSETGRVGASCGRVLHTLDSLASDSSSILSPSRPVCLWDGERNVPVESEDEWGRCSSYAEPAPYVSGDERPYRASSEQYDKSKCHNSAAADVWNDFCKVHWPQLFRKEEQAECSEGGDACDWRKWYENYESNGGCVTAATLL